MSLARSNNKCIKTILKRRVLYEEIGHRYDSDSMHVFGVRAECSGRLKRYSKSASSVLTPAVMRALGAEIKNSAVMAFEDIG